MVLAFERRYAANQAARMKFADTPEKFVDSEVDLDEEAGQQGAAGPRGRGAAPVRVSCQCVCFLYLLLLIVYPYTLTSSSSSSTHCTRAH